MISAVDGTVGEHFSPESLDRPADASQRNWSIAGNHSSFYSGLACSDFKNKARLGRKDFLPVEPTGGLSFLFRLSEPRFA
jgi:hypothetical protein